MELDSKSQSSNMGGNYSGKIKQVPRQNWRVIVRAKISIRDQPGREGKVLGHIRQGDVVEVWHYHYHKVIIAIIISSIITLTLINKH